MNNDRVVGVFEDRAAADKAKSDLVAWGVEETRMTVKRVLQLGHRGFSDSDTVHALIHAPELRESDTTLKDAGTVILIVEVIERPEDSEDQPDPDSGGLDPYDGAALIGALDQLGAADTHIVEATPGLDL